MAHLIGFTFLQLPKRCAVEMIPVQSSAIDSVGYDQAGRLLFIRFKSSQKVYTFYGVPVVIYIGLLNAASKGTFYERNISGKFRQ